MEHAMDHFRVFCLIVALQVSLHAVAQQMTIRIKDYAAMPVTGLTDSKSPNAPYLSRKSLV